LLEAGACDVPSYKSAQRPDLLEAGACCTFTLTVTIAVAYTYTLDHHIYLYLT